MAKLVQWRWLNWSHQMSENLFYEWKLTIGFVCVRQLRESFPNGEITDIKGEFRRMVKLTADSFNRMHTPRMDAILQSKIKLSDGSLAFVFSKNGREPNDTYNCHLCRVRNLPAGLLVLRTHVLGKKHFRNMTTTPDAIAYHLPLKLNCKLRSVKCNQSIIHSFILSSVDYKW